MPLARPSHRSDASDGTSTDVIGPVFASIVSLAEGSRAGVAATPEIATIAPMRATSERHTVHGNAVGHACPRAPRAYGSSGRSGAQAEPLMWLPPSTNSVLPVR